MDLATHQTGTRHQLYVSDWSIAGLGLKPVTDVAAQARVLASRRQGRIVVQGGNLKCVSGRWWPHLGNLMQVAWDTALRRMGQDRCELFYHQPLGSPQFITLSYVSSGPRTSLRTVYVASLVLDEIARLRNAAAIVCNVTNDRITDRLLARWGWETHCPEWSGRHFIKRFYGEYPEIPKSWRRRLAAPVAASQGGGA